MITFKLLSKYGGATSWEVYSSGKPYEQPVGSDQVSVPYGTDSVIVTLFRDAQPVWRWRGMPQLKDEDVVGVDPAGGKLYLISRKENGIVEPMSGNWGWWLLAGTVGLATLGATKRGQ